MAQYIDKEALVAEIEKHFNGYTSSILKHYDACKEAKAQELGKILTIINTLEVKEVDSRLSLEDISILKQIMFDYNRQVRNEISIPNNEDYCKEILKRFKARKGE